MGLLGGNSKSSADTTAVTGTVGNYGSGAAPTVTNSGVNKSTIINATAAPDAAAPVTLFKSKGNTISMSDYGAIQAGRDLSMAALETNGNAFRDAIKQVSDNASAIVNKTLGIAEKTQVSETAQMQDTIIKVAMVAGAAIALVMIFRKG